MGNSDPALRGAKSEVAARKNKNVLPVAESEVAARKNKTKRLKEGRLKTPAEQIRVLHRNGVARTLR